MTENLIRMFRGRGAGWKLGSDLLGRLLQYGLLWAAARTLTMSDFGDFAFALSTGFMLAQVADFGLQLYVQRELARLVSHRRASRDVPTEFTDPEAAARLVGGGLLIKSGLSLVAMLLILILVLVEPVGNKGALVLVGLSMVLGTGLDYLSYCFRALGRLGNEALANLVARAANLVLGAGLLLAGAGVVGLAVAANLAIVAALAVSYARLRAFVAPVWTVDRAYWRFAIGQQSAVGIGMVFSIVSFRLDNVLIPVLLGNGGREALGVYNVAYKLFEPSLIVPAVVLAAIFPALSRAGAGHRGEHFRAVLGPSLGLLTVLGGGVALSIFTLAAPIVGLLYGGQYDASTPLLQILALGCLPMFVNYGLTHALVAADRPRLYAAFMLVALVANAAGNLLLIPTWGTAGAAATTVLCELVLLGLCSVAVWRLSAVRSAPEALAAATEVRS